jgi:cadmium resistance protein CadD (predicted permease)
MDSMLTIIPITVFAFLATNLDNFLVLVSMLAQYRDQSSAVFAGYFAAMLILLTGGFLIGEAADSVPIEYIGLLGMIPMGLGVYGLWQLLSGNADSEDDEPVTRAAWRAIFLAVLLTQAGNGGDTLVTFGVLFADSNPAADTLIVLALAVTAVAVAWLANYALNHRQISRLIKRYAHKITPFIMIGVGAYVLANTATDLV